MPQSFIDIFYQLFLLAVVTIISKIAKDYWESLSTPDKKPLKSLSDLRKARSQFNFSLLLLIASIIAFANAETQFFQGASVMAIVFAIILLWGAFDAVYLPFEKIVNNRTKDVPKEGFKDNT